MRLVDKKNFRALHKSLSYARVHYKTKRETMNEALKEYIRWRKQIEAIQHFGTIDFDPVFLAEMGRRSQVRYPKFYRNKPSFFKKLSF